MTMKMKGEGLNITKSLRECSVNATISCDLEDKLKLSGDKSKLFELKQTWANIEYV
jgi:hypothetical protein